MIGLSGVPCIYSASQSMCLAFSSVRAGYTFANMTSFFNERCPVCAFVLLSCWPVLLPLSLHTTKFADSDDIWENGTVVRYLARAMAVILAVAGLYAWNDNQRKPNSLADSKKKTR